MQKTNFEEVIDNLFNKNYQLVREESYSLPEPKSLFTSAPWRINELQELKHDLNDVKSKLNDYGFDVWHQHTGQRNKAGDVQWNIQRTIRPEFLTQAWCKFYEHLSSFPVVPSVVEQTKRFTSVHLCEAPGAFITSLNHWLKINMPDVDWDWLAMSLNPYYEGNSSKSAINDDRFIIRTLPNWYFGVDNTGNVMNLENVEGLNEQVQGKDVLLVTADGSIDCSQNPGEQEVVVAHLHFCEVVTALNILSAAGTLVLKIFTTFEHQTVCLVYLLICLFEQVHFKKPVTSKEGNSESYIICLGFKGRDFVKPYLSRLKENFANETGFAMFRLEDLPDDFVRKMIECSRFFKDHQCTVIMDNIKTFKSSQMYNDSVVKKIRNLVSLKYIERYNLSRLPDDSDKIVDDNDSCGFKFMNWTNKKEIPESYNQMCKRNSLDHFEKLGHLVTLMQSYHFTAKCFTCEFRNELGELSINEGKPVARILNSKFCYLELLQHFQEFQEGTEKLDFQISLPLKETVNLYIEDMNETELSSCKFVQLDYMSEQNNRITMSSVHNAFKETSEGQCLVLFGYCLLSRFNVGLLFILAHAFDSLELRLSEALGCIITLRGKRVVKSVIQKLNLISEALDRAKNQSHSILSLVPILRLCDDKFYPAILECNAWIINFCITCNPVLKATKKYSNR